MGRTYIQELINHMFIDVELRMRGPYAVTQGRLIKGYMKDLLEQYHGACAAYDEGLIRGDAVLAAAVWRNLFGGGWAGVGGVKGKRAPKAGEAPKLGPNPIQVERNGQVDALSQSSSPSSSESATATATDASLLVDPMQAKLLKKGQSATDVFETDEPIVDPSRAEWTPSLPGRPRPRVCAEPREARRLHPQGDSAPRAPLGQHGHAGQAGPGTREPRRL